MPGTKEKVFGRTDELNPSGVKSKVFSRRILTAKEINEKIKLHKALIGISLPFIKKLQSIVNVPDNAIFLIDNEGCIIEITASDKLNQQFANNFIVPGTYPLTTTILAKAAGNAIIDNVPIMINSGDFVVAQPPEQWSCFAAPISLNNGQPLGCLALCVPSDVPKDYLLSITQFISRCIGNECEYRDEKERAALLRNRQEDIFSKHAYNDLAVDAEGVMYFISMNLAELLGIKSKDYEGKNINQIISKWEDVLKKITKNNQFIDIEIEVENIPNQGRYLLSAKSIKHSTGKVSGFVCSFRGMKKVMNEVNRYIGNYALLTFEDILAFSNEAKKLIKEAKRMAGQDTHLLIFGQKDTGKEAYAQAIHNKSSRSNFGFVRIDLTTIPQQEIEEVLFGFSEKYKPHLKRRSMAGALDFANGGTLFINEIGLLPLHLQLKLLNVLKTGKTQRIEDECLYSVDIRVFATCSKDPPELIDSGKFRLDLFYLLSKSSLRIPPLRERKHDIPLFLNYFLDKKSKELKMKAPVIPKKIESILKRYSWPQNIGELEELCEIIIKDREKMFESFKNEREFKRNHLFLERKKAVESIQTIEDVERNYILNAYNIMGGSISKSARMLGISRNTLYLKFNKYQKEGYL